MQRPGGPAHCVWAAAPKRLLDHLAIGDAESSCAHPDPFQDLVVERHRRSHLRHLRIIASRCSYEPQASGARFVLSTRQSSPPFAPCAFALPPSTTGSLPAPEVDFRAPLAACPGGTHTRRSFGPSQ